MHVLIAPGPFKECLSADAVADAMAKGVRLLWPDAEIAVLPMCDGGSGFSRRITEHASGKLVRAPARDPLGRPIEAEYGIISFDGRQIGVIESAAAAGLALVQPQERNPLVSTTAGVGDLINDAVLNRGCREIFIGCGDSATNDGGAGMISALGARLFAPGGTELSFGGAALANLERIDLSRIPHVIKEVRFRVACNVTSILCGPEGTSAIYGPQKGASKSDVELLEQSLETYARIIEEQLGLDVRFIPGGGAAGGLGAALYAILGARLDFSMNVVREFVDLDSAIARADLVLTGEGCVDRRTATGKVVASVALAAKKHSKPVIALTGHVGPGAHANYFLGLDALVPIAPGPISLEQSVARAAELVEAATFRGLRMAAIRMDRNPDA